MEISDRYSAVGIDHPNPKTVCGGECEGMGIIPVFMSVGSLMELSNVVSDEDETDPVLIGLWEEAEKTKKSCDGYHFVNCPTCNGSGNKD